MQGYLDALSLSRPLGGLAKTQVLGSILYAASRRQRILGTGLYEIHEMAPSYVVAAAKLQLLYIVRAYQGEGHSFPCVCIQICLHCCCMAKHALARLGPRLHFRPRSA